MNLIACRRKLGQAAVALTYDASNRVSGVSGLADAGGQVSAAYVYNGHLKRVKTVEGGQTTYCVSIDQVGARSIQNLSHFRSCDGGSMGLKFRFV